MAGVVGVHGGERLLEPAYMGERERRGREAGEGGEGAREGRGSGKGGSPRGGAGRSHSWQRSETNAEIWQTHQRICGVLRAGELTSSVTMRVNRGSTMVSFLMGKLRGSATGEREVGKDGR